jgi:hypothetical protein
MNQSSRILIISTLVGIAAGIVGLLIAVLAGTVGAGGIAPVIGIAVASSLAAVVAGNLLAKR